MSPRPILFRHACGALAGLCLMAGAAAAQEPPLRSGARAFGDVTQDAPGVRRLIRPEDLPPRPAPSAASIARIVPRPADAVPRAPAGFAVSLFAAGLHEPRTLRVAPDGSVFLAESGAGRVRVWLPGARTGATFADGLERPFGIAFWPPAAPRFVYVAETNRVLRYAWQPGSAVAGAAEIVVPHLPQGGHWTRDLAITPDGATLLISVGSASNIDLDQPPPGGVAAWDAAHGAGAGWGAETGRADVLQLPIAGGTPRIFATGLRNCVSLALQPGTGLPWCVVNERDGMGDDLPPDFATSVRAGGFYGWPWFYIGAHADPRLHLERPDLAPLVIVPDVLFQAHSAPLGIAFYTGGSFPAEYRGDAFVTMHGSWNRAKRTGYKLVRLRFDAGRPTGEYDDFLTGFVTPAGEVWGRPVGVAVAGDGALLVSEDGNGTIWRVAPR